MGSSSSKRRQLGEVTKDSVDFFSFGGTTTSSKIVDIYDGDTVTAVFFVGKRLYKHKCRLLGVDTPELKPRKDVVGRDRIIERAKDAKLYLGSLLPLDGIVKLVVSEKKEKYGRLLVTIFVDGRNINDLMIASGHAKAYDGGTKEEFST